MARLRHSASFSGLSETMKPWIVTRLPTTKPRLGPGGNSASLYCETMPHIATRANGLSRSNTAACTAPPTFSKIRVDAARTGRRQLRAKVERSVVHAVVEAQAVLHPQALLGAAGHTDHARAVPLGELAGDRTHGARGRGDHHRFALLRLADFSDTAIGGRPRHAEYAQIGRQWCTMPRELHQPVTR